MSGTNSLAAGLALQVNGGTIEDLDNGMSLTVVGCGKLQGLLGFGLLAD